MVIISLYPSPSQHSFAMHIMMMSMLMQRWGTYNQGLLVTNISELYCNHRSNICVHTFFEVTLFDHGETKNLQLRIGAKSVLENSETETARGHSKTTVYVMDFLRIFSQLHPVSHIGLGAKKVFIVLSLLDSERPLYFLIVSSFLIWQCE